MRLSIQIFLCLNLLRINSKLLIPKDSQFEIELRQVAAQIPSVFNRQYEVIALTNVDDEIANDFVDIILEETLQVPKLITNETTSGDLSLSELKTGIIVTFFANLSAIDKALSDLKSFSFFSLRANIFFIICTPVEETSWLRTEGARIWEENILNFLFIYYADRLEMAAFNPFLDEEIVHYTNEPISGRMFANKILHLHGHNLTVAATEDLPSVVYRNGAWTGKDIALMNNVLTNINASVQIIHCKSYVTLLENVVSRVADLSLQTKFIFNFSEGSQYGAAEFSYPFVTDGYVLVVPKGKLSPPYLNIFLVFQADVWISIFIACLLITLVFLSASCFSEFQRNEPFLEILRLFINLPTPEFSGALFSKKMLLVFCIALSMILNMAFQSALTSALITPRYLPDIKTLKDLDDSKMPILVAKLFSDISLAVELNEQFVYANKSYEIELILNGVDDRAYGLNNLESADFLVNAAKAKFNREVFRVIRDYLVPGYRAYVFPSGSPYLVTINDMLSKYREFGLEHSIKNLDFKRETSTSSDQNVTAQENDATVVLGLQHVQTAFLILIMGQFVGAFVFFLELVTFKCNKRNKRKRRTKVSRNKKRSFQM